MSAQVTVLNPPLPSKPSHCQSQGCKNDAQKLWYTRWLCNLHFLRAYRDSLGDAA